MIEIALFDTEPAEQYQLEDILTAIMFARDDFKITFYSSHTLFICDLTQNKKNFDILFVNVSTPDNAGLRTAEAARTIDNEMEIVMIAKNYNFLHFGYKVKALDYILKPYDKKQLKETINRFYFYLKKSECFVFKNGASVEKIKLDKILYMVSNGRKIKIVSPGNRIAEFYGKLDEVNEILTTKGFIRTHQSYLVNTKFIRCISRDRLVMDNDDEIPVSRNRFEELKNIFLKDAKVG